MLFKKKKAHVAESPKAKTVVRFSPLESFESPETRSSYLKDETYFLREGNEKLKELLTTWVADRKVIILED